LQEVREDETLWLNFKSFFDIDFSLENLKSKYTRTSIFMGAPLEVEGIRYADKLDRELD